MTRSLSGKVAVVTGASKRLGRAISMGLVERGAKVGLIARSRDELEALAAELGNAALACPCDIRDPAAITAAVESVMARFGRIDILINNAMVTLPNPMHDLPIADVYCEMETNLLGPILLTREVVPHMLAQGSGQIINISSESVGNPYPHTAVYTASKAGLEGFSATLRVELGHRGIRVGVFRSGYIGESASSVLWTAENRSAFYEAAKTTGHDKFSGGPIPLEVQADAVISMATLPPQANIDHMTVRSAH